MKLRLTQFTVSSAFVFAFCTAQLPAQNGSAKSDDAQAAPAKASDQSKQKPNADPQSQQSNASAGKNEPAAASQAAPAATSQTGQTAASAPAAKPTGTANASAPAATAQTTPEAPHPNVKLAGDTTKDHAAQKFIGQHVRSRDGSDLGALHDFLIDPQTGQVDFAVIATGGFAGLGEKFRLVPLGALKRAGESDEFRIEMTEERWNQLATVDSKQLETTPFTMSDSQHRRIAQNFASRTDSAADSGFFTASLTRHLVRATALEDRDVGARQNRLGKIEDVLIDFRDQKAQALVDPSRDFTGLRRKLIVPFSELTIGTGEKPQVTTALTHADFQQLPTSSTKSANASTAAAQAQPAPAAPASGNANAQVANNASPSAASPAAGKSAAPTAKNDTSTVAASSDTSKTGAAKQDTKEKSDEKVAANTSSKSTPSADTAKSAAPAAAKNDASTVAASSDDTAKATTALRKTKEKNDEQVATTAPAQSTPSADAAKKDKDQNENLTPTGKTSADAIPAGTNPALLASARAVRKALDEDPTLAQANIQVTPENDRIVLRGRVNDQKTKTAIIEAATHEIKGWKFDDQISVDKDDTK